MPTFQTAKTIAENALSTIGAFPASQSQADAGEMKKTLKWLEMILNMQSGIRPMAGFWRIVEIPLEASIGDYDLADYVDSAETQQVFSVSLVDGLDADPVPLDMIWESDAVNEDLSDTGNPCRVTVTKDALPVLKVYPMPVQSNQDAGQLLRIRIQTYHEAIDSTGVADSDVRLRPSWYLWITKRLAYEIGCGPVRRLDERELAQLQGDAAQLETLLLARDGKGTSPTPPVTLPMAGS